MRFFAWSGPFADEVEEELVDSRVGAELGVEGGGEEMAFADEDREAVAGGEGFDCGPVWVMRGARMKTISSGPPGSLVGAVRMVESIWRP